MTTFGCCSSFRSEISLIEVDGTPSSSLSKRIFFSATNWLVFLFFALYTTPYVPRTKINNGCHVNTCLLTQMLFHIFKSPVSGGFLQGLGNGMQEQLHKASTTYYIRQLIKIIMELIYFRRQCQQFN